MRMTRREILLSGAALATIAAAPKRPRLAVAMLSHEGNSFAPVTIGFDEFRSSVWAKGDEAQRFTGSATELGGVLAFAAANPGWQVDFLRLAQATPSGPVRADVYDAIVAEVVADLKADGSYDAVLLILHGALLVEGRDLADLAFVQAVRDAVGPGVALGASFDLHANIDPRLVALLDGGSGYKTHPHVDQAEAAQRALTMLKGKVEGRLNPAGALVKAKAILPSINMRTADGPMAELETVAAAMIGGKVLDAVPFGGFSYGDSVAAGASALVFTDGDRTLAQATATRLAGEIDARTDRFFMALPKPAEAIRKALAGPKPVAIVDAGDNPLSGGVADTPELLRALIAAKLTVPTLFAFFWDPTVVEAARAVGIGGMVEGTLGGRLTPDFGAPVPFRAKVLKLTEGKFDAQPPFIIGTKLDFGRTALLRIERTQIDVIVTSICASPHDPGLLTLHGLKIGDHALLAIKAKNHFRAAYGPHLAAIIDTDAPGPAALDIASFPFRKAPKTLIPLNRRPG
ncbi:M81 family metallopeptidase [Sphingoaurantiacus capsulatus]|uniref:Microcystinase C n=1 Tax=Sphingoaurantiacus capsulatus TaxID=1771310 RepID=A0ABV7XFN5_9SPHN